MASSSSSSSPEIPHVPSTFDSSFFAQASLDDVLEDLSTRFIMNLPDQELASKERLCFQVEQAHWYYEDFMREVNPKLPTLPLKKFSLLLFNSSPLLRQWATEHEQLFNTFMHYKVRVPVCGAIMLNDKWDKCILVKGWKSSAGWGFPKGKINQDEPSHECASREVAEETGFNLSSQIRPDDFIELTIREQRITLFIVGGVPEDYPFQTKTRKEISKIEWFKLADLPGWKRGKQVPGKFYLISPFIPALKEFIKANKPGKRRQNRRKSGGSNPADISIQTDFEGVSELIDGEGLQGPVYSAVSLDRDVHGYSSSSVDNGEPQTPSPQSTEALPVVTEGNEESSFPMDPHFARLLNGLSLSASKPLSHGQPELRPTSVTPTAAKNKVSASSEEKKSVTKSPVIPKEINRSLSPIVQASVNNQLSLSNVQNLLSSSNPSNLPLIGRPQTAFSLSSISTLNGPSGNRHAKHLALLESVAQEATSKSPVTTSRQPVSLPPMTPSQSRPDIHVPPAHNHLPGGRHPGSQGALPSLMRPVPPADDAFTVRPMTSQAVFPPGPPVRRHGPNLSIHQGSLLSILSGSTPAPPSTTGPAPFMGLPPYVLNKANNAGQGNPPFVPIGITGNPVGTPQTSPLRMRQPPLGPAPPLNNPLVAPFVPNHAQIHPQPHPPLPGVNGLPIINSMASRPPIAAANSANLLSLLNTRPTPTTVPKLQTDVTRPNYSTSNPSAPIH